MLNRNRFRHSPRRSLEGERLIFSLGVIAFLLASVLLLAAQIADPSLAIEWGMVIPDVANMSAWLQDFMLDDPPWLRADQLPGPWLLYASLGPPSPVTCLGINSMVMVGAAACWWQIAKRALPSPGWAVTALIANPYLLLAMTGPNKEIPVLFLTLLLVLVVSHQRPFWMLHALVICSAVYTFRDGYGVILLGWALSIRFFGGRTGSAVVSLVVVATCVSVILGDLGTLLPFIGRQIARAQDPSTVPSFLQWLARVANVDPSAPLAQPIFFAARVFYNGMTQALFPVVLTDDEKFHVLGVAYFLNGLVILSVVPVCVLILANRNASRSWGTLASGLFLAVLILSSLSPHVQPRYLLPLWPMAYLVFSSYDRRTVAFAVVGACMISCAVCLVYYFSGHPPASARPFNPEIDLELSAPRDGAASCSSDASSETPLGPSGRESLSQALDLFSAPLSNSQRGGAISGICRSPTWRASQA
jgi:hypothetical protein